LHHGGDCEDRERERDGPDSLAGALDALVYEAVRMPMFVFTVIIALLLVVVVGVVFVRPAVWVGVAQRAVTVQIASDGLIGG
jgi:hypothetical protein